MAWKTVVAVGDRGAFWVLETAEGRLSCCILRLGCCMIDGELDSAESIDPPPDAGCGSCPNTGWDMYGFNVPP